MTVRVVAVATATVWTAPDAPRPVDAPALGAPSRVAEWTGAMTVADRYGLHGRVETQALLGETVQVDDEHGDWSHVVLPAQPSSKDPRGYPGWVPTAQLTSWEAPEPTATVVVRVPTTTVRAAPDGAIEIDDVSFGTLLAQAGPVSDGWLPVHTPGATAPGWVPAADVTTTPPELPTPQQVLDAAGRFRGLAYLWGGTSGLGLDCSGLVHLVFRRYAVSVPRDAHDQAAFTGTSVLPDDARPGDLLFFAEPGKQIHHVGIAAGDGRMLHAPETGTGIEVTALIGRRREQLVAANRWH